MLLFFIVFFFFCFLGGTVLLMQSNTSRLTELTKEYLLNYYCYHLGQFLFLITWILMQ